MDIKKRIQELSLDQKAKLYFMGLVRQGKIDRLPEDPKAAYMNMLYKDLANVGKDKMDKDDYGRSVSGKDKRTFMEPEDSMPAARARKLAGMEESKLLDRIKEKPTVEERTAVLNYWLSKSPSRSQLPDIFDLDKENYKGNDPLILSYIEKMDQDIPSRILRQENAFFNGELIRMLNHPDDQEYIQMHKDTIVHNGVDPFGNKLTPQNHDVMADEAKADPDLAETKTLKEIATKLGYLKEMKVTDKDSNDVTSDIIKKLEKSYIKNKFNSGKPGS